MTNQSFTFNNIGALGQAAATFNTERQEPGSTQAGAVVNVQLSDGSEVTFTYQPGDNQ